MAIFQERGDEQPRFLVEIYYILRWAEL